MWSAKGELEFGKRLHVFLVLLSLVFLAAVDCLAGVPRSKGDVDGQAR